MLGFFATFARSSCVSPSLAKKRWTWIFSWQWGVASIWLGCLRINGRWLRGSNVTCVVMLCKTVRLCNTCSQPKECMNYIVFCRPVKKALILWDTISSGLQTSEFRAWVASTSERFSGWSGLCKGLVYVCIALYSQANVMVTRCYVRVAP